MAQTRPEVGAPQQDGVPGTAAVGEGHEDSVVATLCRWADSHKSPDKPLLAIGRKALTPRQIAKEARKGTPFGKSLKQEVLLATIDRILGRR